MKYLIIVSKTEEILDLMRKDTNQPKLNTPEWLTWYDSYHIDGSVVPLQTEFKELAKKFKLRKDIVIYPSEVFSYQNQGVPTKDDIVILVNGMDRYGYCKDIKCYEFNNYNSPPYSLDLIDRIVNPTTLINYTPHDIILNDVVIEPSGIVARCDEIIKGNEKLYNNQYGELIIVNKSYSDVTIMKLTDDSMEVGIFPEPKENTLYLVSAMCATKLKGRQDVVYPNEMIRDKFNRVIGCRSFARV